ncbi:hypothetical protein Pcinc_035833 [Petrolisthes cinctipes]|uniref:Carbohydrate sulfotransferase n=1 Tax=Petrolisthes cinctipes TaxID=88211 RepID=A0AAE1BWV7_PETCI|nr:hypothetical protein Pcinc_035833 [Petrolisthes cinctipes]
MSSNPYKARLIIANPLSLSPRIHQRQHLPSNPLLPMLPLTLLHPTKVVLDNMTSKAELTVEGPSTSQKLITHTIGTGDISSITHSSLQHTSQSSSPPVTELLLNSSDLSVPSNIAEHWNSEGNSGLFQNLTAVLSLRMENLNHQCQRLNQTELLPWHKQMILTVYPGPLTFCLVPKVATTSLRALGEVMNGVKPTSPHPVNVLVARHPLLRLLSAYRDKYLGGAALGQYGPSWQRVTGSKDTWINRLFLYWLPALVSTGRLAGQSQVIRLLVKNLQISHRMLTRYFSSTGEMLAFPPTEEVIYYGPEEMTIATHMILSGSHWGLFDAVKRGLNLVHPQSTLANVNFTLTEFLRHVLWTHKYRVPDHHWMATSTHCRPCSTSLHYLLHLEHLDVELNHLLHSVLGYPHNLTLPRKNRSDKERGYNRMDHNLSTKPQQDSSSTQRPDQIPVSTPKQNPTSPHQDPISRPKQTPTNIHQQGSTPRTTRLEQDLREFKAVPRDLMTEIINIYKEDFLLLGYKANQILT